MTCARMQEYFTAGNDAFSNASFHDFQSYDDYFKAEGREGCLANKCIPPKLQKLRDSDAGVNMYFSLKDKPVPTKLSLQTSDVTTSIEPVLPSECCHHREHKIKRKFICNFASISANPGNQCLEMERSRCQAFWKLIDQRAELQSLIRLGEFEHINIPQIAGPRKPKDVSIRCQESEVLRAKNKAVHEEEKERVIRRKQMLDELQAKSGQAIFVRRKSGVKSVNLIPQPVMNFTQLVEEMNAYDKRVRNPVRTKLNPPSATSFEWVAPNFSSSGENSTASYEGESSGEEEEALSLSDTGAEHRGDDENGESDEHEEQYLSLSGESGESIRA